MTRWLTGRNATGRAAESLLAVPGTIARKTRADPVAADPDHAGADPGRLRAADPWPLPSTPTVTPDRPAGAGRWPFGGPG